jgi:hypothetical protein
MVKKKKPFLPPCRQLIKNFTYVPNVVIPHIPVTGKIIFIPSTNAATVTNGPEMAACGVAGAACSSKLARKAFCSPRPMQAPGH